jgi:hypothetical protein
MFGTNQRKKPTGRHDMTTITLTTTPPLIEPASLVHSLVDQLNWDIWGGFRSPFKTRKHSERFSGWCLVNCYRYFAALQLNTESVLAHCE